MKKLLKGLLFAILTPILLFACFLIYSTIVNYQPVPVEQISEAKGKVIDIRDTLNIFNWNIGYCGLGDNMSFFYDGGAEVRTTKERTYENLAAIVKQLEAHDSIHFYLLQEVDLSSKRSYRTNQFDTLKAAFSDYFPSFAFNYKVNFVPVPPTEPLGKVNSGLVSFSKFEPFVVSRHAFEGNYSWPKELFMLDRCFMVQRFYTSNGKELLIINTHNSAYDDGSLRKRQMKMMRGFLQDEYAKGNYIIVGGDWNQMPPKKGDNEEYKDKHLTRIRIDAEVLPNDWQWSFCEAIPTNRMINEVYNPKTTQQTTIDFFLSSPNVKVNSHQNIDLQFKNSDHQPLLFSFSFLDD